MAIDDYLVPKESTKVEVQAKERQSALSDYTSGTIAVTSNRLAFVGTDGSVTDISLNGVSSFEYRPPQLPRDWLIGGIISIVTGVVLFVLQRPIEDGVGAGDIALGLGVLFLLLGLGLMGWAFVNRKAVVSVHTPNMSYRFTSTESDLQKVMHAVRGQER